MLRHHRTPAPTHSKWLSRSGCIAHSTLSAAGGPALDWLVDVLTHRSPCTPDKAGLLRKLLLTPSWFLALNWICQKDLKWISQTTSWTCIDFSCLMYSNNQSQNHLYCHKFFFFNSLTKGDKTGEILKLSILYSLIQF